MVNGRIYNISLNEELIICNEYIVEKLSANKIAKLHNFTLYKINEILDRYEIKKRDNIESKKKYKINENFFETIDTKEKAYILGFIYADGTLQKKEKSSACMVLEITYEDNYILEKFNKIMEHDRPLYIRKKREESWHDSAILNIISNKIVSDLINAGVNFKKTNNLKYPNFLDEKLHSHFIRGMFDGDGCINIQDKTDATWHIIGTPEICTGICDQLFKVEIDTNIRNHTRYSENVKLSNVETHKLESICRLFEYLYKDSDGLYLTRKYNKFLELDFSLVEYRNNLFDNIEKLAAEGYRVFEIAEILNCTTAYVHRAKKKRNIEILNPIKYEEYYNEIYNLYDSGKSQAYISKFLNIPAFNINNIINRRNSKINNRHPIGPKQLKYQPYFEKIRNLTLSGKSPYEISDELEISVNIIYNYLRTKW